MKCRSIALTSIFIAALSIPAAGQSLQTVKALRQKALAQIPTRMNEIVPGEIMVKYTRNHAIAIERSTLKRFGTLSPVGEQFVNRLADTGWTLWKVPLGTDIHGLCRQLKAANSGVISAEPVNKIYPLQLATPNDPDFNYFETDPNLVFSNDGTFTGFRRCWNLDDSNAFPGWSIYPGYWMSFPSQMPSYRPLIAFIDTGADTFHPDFINAGGTGTDVSQGGQIATNLSAYFTLGAEQPGGSFQDVYGHGTHVTGIAMAAGNNGPFSASVDNGMIGIGYNAEGMILRVFDDNNNGSDDDAAAAIYWATDHGAAIINLSLGTTNFSQVFQDAVTYAFQKGSAVFAAGNENGNGGGNLGPIYPACCSGACAVAAAGPGPSIAGDYAGTGNYLDVAAPGGDVIISSDFSSFMIQYVWSTAMEVPGGLYNDPNVNPPYTLNYAYLAGTSMATPHVSGLAALYDGMNHLGQTSGFANVQVYRAIERAAQGIGAPNGGWEPNFGYGYIDCAATLGNQDSRGATVGSVAGIVYYNATPVGNVNVVAIVNGTTFSTTTASDGTYRFDALPPGVAHMSAAPFGSNKKKNVPVVAGSDTPGEDFWCGTQFGDWTSPTVYRLQVVGTHSPTTMQVSHWGYDVETSIDKINMEVGTTPGGHDVVAPVEVLFGNRYATLHGNFVTGTTYYVTVAYCNGAGKSKQRTTSVVW